MFTLIFSSISSCLFYSENILAQRTLSQRRDELRETGDKILWSTIAPWKVGVYVWYVSKHDCCTFICMTQLCLRAVLSRLDSLCTDHTPFHSRRIRSRRFQWQISLYSYTSCKNEYYRCARRIALQMFPATSGMWLLRNSCSLFRRLLFFYSRGMVSLWVG